MRAAREQELVGAEATLRDLCAGLRRLCGELLPRGGGGGGAVLEWGGSPSAALRLPFLGGGGEEPAPVASLARQGLGCVERLLAARLGTFQQLETLTAEAQTHTQARPPPPVTSAQRSQV